MAMEIEILGYLGALLTGVSLGLVGGGGSILIVPVLVYLFSVSPSTATAYSLFVVGVASIFGAIGYAKKGLIDYRTAMVFSLPAFVGVFAARRFVVPNLPEEIFSYGSVVVSKDILIMMVFALVMLVASYSMIRKSKNVASEPEDGETEGQVKYNYKLIALEGFAVGAVTGFVGAGGGFLIVPALVMLANLPMKKAVGTSLMIISAKSLFGFLGDVTGNTVIDWNFLSVITLTSVAGIFLGNYLSNFIPGKKLKPAFGWFVLVMGNYILLKQIV